ncbi:hypothetical protein WJX72_004944 [[Myrmecia] bisecta]|uniref:uridine/cytidine kinase n=1 Tax=[Myrmecia] bisecta TaxID=41462 RepID=A0AAW1PQ28_9CHLO
MGTEAPTARVPFVIGVAGGTASGKTSVCDRIIRQLNSELTADEGLLNMSMDSFYRDLTPSEQKDIANFNFDHPDAFAFDEIVHTLRDLKQGEPVHIPIYDFVTSSRRAETIPVPRADVILFDGILAFYNPELRDLFDMKIFVDTDADTRLARRVRRDITHRGRDVLQVLDQYERTVKPSFESYILPTKKHADIIVPRGAENEVAIDLILQHIKFRLAKPLSE